jgi:hypothetical protein
VKNLFRITLSVIVFSLLAACSMPLHPATPLAQNTPAPATAALSPPTAAPSFTLSPTATVAARSNRFGFFVGTPNKIVNTKVIQPLNEIGNVGWVRLEIFLGETGQDYTPYLAAGFNVILTIVNKNPDNIVTDYGTAQDWPGAGFPFQKKDQYQQDIRTLLQPAVAYLQQGRQVWVQAENEETDATVEKNAIYWRGTDEQYLAQSQAFYTAVKSVSPNIRVALTSFAGYMLENIANPNMPGYAYSVQHVTLLLTQAKYDGLDLHFYKCVEDIPNLVKALKALVPAGQPFVWISTENGGPMANCKSTRITWQQDLAQYEKLQAEQLPERLSACIANGGRICLWFSFFDLHNIDDTFNHLGVIDLFADPARKKPAYVAYQAFTAKQQK